MPSVIHPRQLSAILCADWGKDFPKRAVYVADISARIVRRIPSPGWTVASVLAEAERWTSNGAVLATFDAPLGVPASYLSALSALTGAKPVRSFLDLVSHARSLPRFYDPSASATDWSPERPFFAVPAGKGGLESYAAAAARQGVELYRRMDRMTGAKSVFVKSGIPGSVGSAASALWQELAPRLDADRAFRVWPFEGKITALLQTAPIVVGEMYPRAAYATALLDEPVESRPPLVVAKTDPAVRAAAVTQLRRSNWVRCLQVSIENLDEAEASEDDFDACLTAAALLRCALDGSPFAPAVIESADAEGGILGTGSINLRLAPLARLLRRKHSV